MKPEITFKVASEDRLSGICEKAYELVAGKVPKFCTLVLEPQWSAEESRLMVIANYVHSRILTKVVALGLVIQEISAERQLFLPEHIRRSLVQYGSNEVLDASITVPEMSEGKIDFQSGKHYTLGTRAEGLGLRKQENQVIASKDCNYKILLAMLDLAKIEYQKKEDGIFSIAREQPRSNNIDNLIQLYEWSAEKGYFASFHSKAEESEVIIQENVGLDKKTQEEKYLRQITFKLESPKFLWLISQPIEDRTMDGLQKFLSQTFSLEINGCEWKINGSLVSYNEKTIPP